ncbi:MAG: putative transposase, partial [Bacteroidetes bacterium]|nr:putative transposase [Bacteroidota bacterium]
MKDLPEISKKFNEITPVVQDKIVEILNGKRKGVQYYLCKKCHKNFNEFTGTTVSYLKKKDILKPFIRSMLSGDSLYICSKRHHIAIQTAFNWRHKIIAAFK